MIRLLTVILIKLADFSSRSLLAFFSSYLLQPYWYYAAKLVSVVVTSMDCCMHDLLQTKLSAKIISVVTTTSIDCCMHDLLQTKIQSAKLVSVVVTTSVRIVVCTICFNLKFLVFPSTNVQGSKDC